MKVIDRGTVFMGEAGSEFSSACFHGLCVTPAGRWMVAFRASPKKANAQPQRILITWSDDEGKSWSTPIEPFRPCSIKGVPGAWRGMHVTPVGPREILGLLYWVDVSDPALPFFNEKTEGLLDSRLFLTRSGDAGRTWTEPKQIETAPYDCPVPFTGPILARKDGVWVLQFETNKTYNDTSVWLHQAVLMFSRDKGRTWGEAVVTGADPEGRVFYWDQRPNLLADGSVLDVFWTFDRKTASYRNIHARLSRDGGHQWSEIWDTGIPGQGGPPVSLKDGSIAMPYVDRTKTPIIKLRVSKDSGRTWPASTEVIIDDSTARPQEGAKGTMQDAWSEMGAYSIGLPMTARLANGDVLVAYYSGPKTDHTGIRWARVG